MIYCHECGSEVAETDAFCPFCGITLQQPESDAEVPKTVEPEIADEEFDSTIVMSSTELAAQREAISGSEEAEEPIVSDAPPIDEDISVDVDSIPTPGVIADLEKSLLTGGETKESYEYTQEIEPDEIEVIAENSIDEPEEVVAENEVSEVSVEELEIKETEPQSVEIESSVTSEVIPETAVGETKETEPESEITISEPLAASVEDVPEDIEEEPKEMPAGGVRIEHEFTIPVEEDPEETISSDLSEADAESTTSVVEPEDIQNDMELEETVPETEDSVAETELEPTNSVEILEEADVVAEPSDTSSPEKLDSGEMVAASEISMPADELEASDPYLRASQFDSVRIVDQEGFKPHSEDGNQMIDPIAHTTGGGENGDGSTGSPSGKTDTTGKRSAKLTPLTEGTILLNRYEIVRKIGGGGMGAVYLASDSNLGGVVRAVKEMVQAHIEEEQQAKAVDDFKRESMILSSLDHVSIPTIFDYFYDDNEGRFYLVMKYISGGDLAARLRAAPEGKIEELTVTEWALQIIDVLDYLHSQPSTIVYRDLKPSNIMIDGNSGRIMLIDFGIARSINQKEEKGVTAVGTMGYAPPELFSGKVEPRSDIYSLGSTMFHLLTGADPQSNPLLIFDFQKNPRPRQINPQLSDQIETILMHSVEYNADARFTSAAEMRAVLEEHLANLKSGRVTHGVSEAPASVSLANQSVFCGFCGQNIVATDLFCAFCGAKQPIAQHGVHSEIYSVESHPAKLVIQASGDLQGSNYTLIKTENLIGRRDPMSNIFPEIDLSKYDPQTKISRRHAKVWSDGAKYYVEDLGSSNGTVISPKTGELLRLVPHRPHPITNGDTIKVGDTTLYFIVG